MRTLRAISSYLASFLFSGCAPHQHLHSFPTRRSSDLLAERMHVLARGEAGPDQPLGTLALREVVGGVDGDRKSTRLNSSHTVISYAVFCFKKKIYKICIQFTVTSELCKIMFGIWSKAD